MQADIAAFRLCTSTGMLPRIGHGADLPAMLGRENHSMQYVCQLLLPVDGIAIHVYFASNP